MAKKTQDPVVVGVDGSASAVHAVHWAALEAARRDAPLLLVHVWTPVPASVPHAAALGPYEDGLITQGRQWLTEASEIAAGAAPGVPTSSRLMSGSAAGHLIGTSASAALLVLGSRGLGGFTGLVVGSIAVAVATHGHCPVVVVRGTDPQEPPRQDGPVVVRDGPTHALLDQAKRAQLVVTGSRGRGGFRGLLLGSTSQALIQHAACPVAVVPPSRA